MRSPFSRGVLDLRALHPAASQFHASWRFALLVARVVGLLFIVGCATGSSGERDSQARNALSAQELQETRATNVLELIEQERPSWLISRGPRSVRLETEIIVVVNETYYGDISGLRDFQPWEFHRIRYLDGVTASSIFLGIGSRHVEAAIVLETRDR